MLDLPWSRKAVKAFVTSPWRNSPNDREIDEIKALGHDAEANLLKVGAGKPTMIETGFTFELSTEDLGISKLMSPRLTSSILMLLPLLHSLSYGQKKYFKPCTMLYCREVL